LLSPGADLYITSIHTALMGYSQTATVSCRTGRVDPARLDRCVDMTATTSPSATLLASNDASRQIMALDGRGLVARAAEVTATARTRLHRVRGLVVLDEATLGCAVDPLKLSIFLPGTGAHGADVAADLLAAVAPGAQWHGAPNLTLGAAPDTAL
jgi:arginine decarboxylase